MRQQVPGASPFSSPQKHGRIATAFLFAAAIVCSLSVHATSAGQPDAPSGTASQCVGAPGAQLLSPFADYYSCLSLGAPFGLETLNGGLTFKYDDPNTLLIAGASETSGNRIFKIGVTRDANMHVNGFSGTPTLYPRFGSTIGQSNDGGLAFGPGNVLFGTRYPVNQLEQSKPGSVQPDKVNDLTPLGVASSVGALAFVPPGFPGAGRTKLISFTTGGWYDVNLRPDGSGMFDSYSAALRANVGSGEGIAFVPPGSTAFPTHSVLIAQYSTNTIITAPLDANGDPIAGNEQMFIQGVSGPAGATIDPLTGDFLFCSVGAGPKIIRVSGFAGPSVPAPTPTPGRCQFRVLIAYSDLNGAAPYVADQIRLDPDVAALDFFDASTSTPTLPQLQQYDIVMAFSNGAFQNSDALGSNLADYVDAGGVAVQVGNSFLGPGSPNGINGRWVTGNYSPFNYSVENPISNYSADIVDPTHALMAGVKNLHFNFLAAVTLTPGATRVASAFAGGDPLVAYRLVNGGHTTVGIAAYLGFPDAQSGDWGKVVVNAGRWLRPCDRTSGPTPTPTATATATATPTPTATATPTSTPTSTPAATPKATATATPAITPSTTPAATATPTATATATPSVMPSATPTPTPPPDSHLANISTRMRVEAGDNALIAGFIVQGSDSKRLIIRGIGPSLAAFGIGDALQDPTLELFNGNAQLGENDNWSDNANSPEIVAAGLTPGNEHESALLVTLPPGSYTAALRGKNGSTGVGLVEVYDLDAGGPAKVVNISTRGFVQTGNNVMIAGLIISGDDGSGLVLRGIGPSLSDFGVPNVLSDPLLELHDGNGALIQANNNWRETQEMALRNTGLAPTNDLEAAIVIGVPPGNYTALLRGADVGIGNGLVEVYQLPRR